MTTEPRRRRDAARGVDAGKQRLFSETLSIRRSSALSPAAQMVANGHHPGGGRACVEPNFGRRVDAPKLQNATKDGP